MTADAVVDEEGHLVDGVHPWPGMDKHSCGIVIESYDLALHADSWSWTLTISGYSRQLLLIISMEDDVETGLRLPHDIAPTNYHVKLEPDYSSDFVEEGAYIAFNGSVNIAMAVLKETQQIVLHADEMTITNFHLEEISESGLKKEVEIVLFGADFQRTFLYIYVGEPLSTKLKYNINLEFSVATLTGLLSVRTLL